MPDDYNSKRIKQRNKSVKVYNEIAKIYLYKCAVCGWHLPYKTPDGKNQPQGGCDVHHITPHSEGGADTIENLILLCPNHHKEADTGLLSKATIYANYHKTTIDMLEYLRANHTIR